MLRGLLFSPTGAQGVLVLYVAPREAASILLCGARVVSVCCA